MMHPCYTFDFVQSLLFFHVTKCCSGRSLGFESTWISLIPTIRAFVASSLQDLTCGTLAFRHDKSSTTSVESKVNLLDYLPWPLDQRPCLVCTCIHRWIRHNPMMSTPSLCPPWRIHWPIFFAEAMNSSHRCAYVLSQRPKTLCDVYPFVYLLMQRIHIRQAKRLHEQGNQPIDAHARGMTSKGIVSWGKI